MNLRFGDLSLLVQDYAAQFRFYRDTLELPVTWGDEQTGYAQFKLGALVLAILGRQEMAAAVGTGDHPPAALAQDRFALCFSVDDVDGTCRDLAAKGVPFVNPPHDRADLGYRVAHFRDADGNLLELYAPLHTGP